jgi:hypothetical protein
MSMYFRFRISDFGFRISNLYRTLMLSIPAPGRDVHFGLRNLVQPTLDGSDASEKCPSNLPKTIGWQNKNPKFETRNWRLNGPF